MQQPKKKKKGRKDLVVFLHRITFMKRPNTRSSQVLIPYFNILANKFDLHDVEKANFEEFIGQWAGKHRRHFLSQCTLKSCIKAALE